MKAISLLLTLILFFSPVVLAKEEAPYTVVFCSYDLQWNWSDNTHHFDKFEKAKTWTGFEKFCQDVKLEAGVRPVLFILSVHGLDYVPVLAVSDSRRSYVATQAGVINKLEKYFSDNNLTVIEECCMGGIAYHGSINPPPELVKKIKGCLLEGRQKGNPIFKVLGFPNYRSVPPVAFEQYIHRDFQTLEDLRQYKDKAPVQLNKQLEEISALLQRIVLDTELKKDGIERIRLFY
jgi:hypothetical protein